MESTPDRVFAIFTSLGRHFGDILFSFLRSKSLLKGVYYKRKEFAPPGSKLFPLKVNAYSKGRKNNFEKDVALQII